MAPERLGEYVKAFRAILDRHGLEAGFYGHCSVGCLHVRPFVDLTEPGGVETMAAVADEIAELVAEFDGVNSSEHGDGRVRSPFNPRVFGDDLYERVPQGQGAVRPRRPAQPRRDGRRRADDRRPARPRAPARAAAAHALRLRGRDARAPPTAASASAPAARPATGVMCPSYMATREEEHATRGRANALVKALSRARSARRAGRRAAARDPRPLPRVQGVQERVPAERRHGDDEGRVPLALPGAARDAAALAAVRGDPAAQPARRGDRAAVATSRCRARCSSAWRASTAAGRSRASRARRCCAGTSGARGGAARAATSSSSPTRSRPSPSPPSAAPRSSCWRPRAGRAAGERAAAAGARASRRGCSTRRAGWPRQMVERLAPDAERGVPIVGCEPSCLLTLREEHPGAAARRRARADGRGADAARRGAARRGDRRRRAGAARRRRRRRPPDPLPRPLPPEGAGRHGGHGRAARAHPRRRRSTELDAGCCGMAGSFGFEAEHYDLSMQIGEQRLFPALRATPRRARWSPRPACRAASRSGTVWGTARGILSSS